MTHRYLWALLALSLASTARAQPASPPDAADCFIDAAKVASPPRFADFPARPVSLKPAAALMTNGLARRFRTELRRQAAGGPNFAGHFTIATWGCGSSCFQFAIVDARTGQVFGDEFPAFATDHAKEMNGPPFRLNSRLIILTGAMNEDEDREGVHYAVWTGRSLKFIRFVPRSQVCSPSMLPDDPRKGHTPP
jgi:hypothetical protein